MYGVICYLLSALRGYAPFHRGSSGQYSQYNKFIFDLAARIVNGHLPDAARELRIKGPGDPVFQAGGADIEG